MSVQRNAPACVQNASPITKSLSSMWSCSLSPIVASLPSLVATVPLTDVQRGGPRRGNDSQLAIGPFDHRDGDDGGARSIVTAPYALVAKPHSCR